jgi:hypothetical protein
VRSFVLCCTRCGRQLTRSFVLLSLRPHRRHRPAVERLLARALHLACRQGHCTHTLSGDFGGQRLTPGVYCIASAATFSQNVILDAAVHGAFVFKINGAFDAVATRSIMNVNGAPEVFYAVSGAATLGAHSRVYGTIVATAAITLGSESSIGGRALSLIGVVNIGDHATVGPQLFRQAHLEQFASFCRCFLPRLLPCFAFAARVLDALLATPALAGN